MPIVQWIDRYVPTTQVLEVGHPQDIYRLSLSYIFVFANTQDIYRLISDVDVSSTRTVLRGKYVRMPSVWRDAGKTQLALVGTRNAKQEWRAASFVKTYNALKVTMVLVKNV